MQEIRTISVSADLPGYCLRNGMMQPKDWPVDTLEKAAMEIGKQVLQFHNPVTVVGNDRQTDTISIQIGVDILEDQQ